MKYLDLIRASQAGELPEDDDPAPPPPPSYSEAQVLALVRHAEMRGEERAYRNSLAELAVLRAEIEVLEALVKVKTQEAK